MTIYGVFCKDSRNGEKELVSVSNGVTTILIRYMKSLERILVHGATDRIRILTTRIA